MGLGLCTGLGAGFGPCAGFGLGAGFDPCAGLGSGPGFGPGAGLGIGAGLRLGAGLGSGAGLGQGSGMGIGPQYISVQIGNPPLRHAHLLHPSAAVHDKPGKS